MFKSTSKIPIMKIVCIVFSLLFSIQVFAITGELTFQQTETVNVSETKFFQRKAGFKAYKFILKPSSLDMNNEFVIKAATVFNGRKSKLYIINDVQEYKVTIEQAKRMEFIIVSGIANGIRDKDRSIICNMSSGYMVAGVIVEIWNGDKTKCIKHFASYSHSSCKTKLSDELIVKHLDATGFEKYPFNNKTSINLLRR